MTRERMLEILDNNEFEDYKDDPNFVKLVSEYKEETKLLREKERQERRNYTLSYIRDGKIDILTN